MEFEHIGVNVINLGLMRNKRYMLNIKQKAAS